MSTKLKILWILIAVLVVLFLVNIVWGLLSKNSQTSQNDQQAQDLINKINQNTDTTPTNTNQNSTNQSSTSNGSYQRTTPQDVEASNLMRIADSFAAIFGSYSNQSNFENFRDLESLMTPKMQTWMYEYIIANQTSAKAKVYFGVTTKAISSKVISSDATQAEVLVHTQRKESTATQNNSRVYYQDIQISLEKVGGIWKVGGAYWQ